MTATQPTLDAICTSARRGVVKRAVGAAELRAGHGIVGDAHAGGGHRQVSILAAESIAAVREQIPDLAHGAFAENLVTRGLDLGALAVGSVLRVGAARLEVTQIGKECHQACAIQLVTGDCIMPREGVFCRVIEGGAIAVGDPVAIES
jgi:cyclic pyranopterin phosphate synthase